MRAFFFSSLTGGTTYLPTGVVLSWTGSVDVMESTTGVLLFSVSITPPANVTGSATGAYAAPTGACVSWVTSGVVGGHRVAGRTFLVPLGQVGFENDGTLAPGVLTAVNSAASTLISAPPEFVIWHRPDNFAAGNGSAHPVLASKITDKAAVLTSRR
jgi:hypothetical protein